MDGMKKGGKGTTRTEGKMMIGYPRDDSSAMAGQKEQRMGGSKTNLSHSLSGTSANQKGTG